MTFKPGDVGHLAEHDRISGELAGRLSDTSLSATFAGKQPGLAPSRTLPPQTRRMPRTVLTNNPGADGWAFVSADASSVLTDAVGALYGTGCATLVTKGDGTQSSLRKTNAGSFDLSMFDVELIVKFDDLAHLATGSISFQARLGNTALANYNATSLYNGAEGLSFLGGEWYRLRFANSDNVSAGVQSRFNVSDFDFSVWDDNTGNKVTMHIQQIALVPKSALFATGLVTLTFDDNWDLSNVLPKTAQYGYAATAYPILETIGMAGHLSLTQLRQLRSLHGWEVGAHALTLASHNAGFPSLSAVALDKELSGTKEWMRVNGFTSESLAYPRGLFSDSVCEQSRQYFSNARTTTVSPRETVPPEDAMRIRCISIVPGHTLGYVQGLLDRAQAQGTWLQLCFHEVATAPTAGNGNWITPTFFGQIVDEIAKRGMAVLNMQDALRAMETEPSNEGVALELLSNGEETISRVNLTGGQNLTSGTVRFGYFTARKTEPVNNLRTMTHTVAAVGLTFAKMGLYSVGADGSLTLIASTASDPTLFTATGTVYSRATTATAYKVRGKRYAWAVLVIGTTPNNLGTAGGIGSGPEYLTAPMIGATLAGQSDLPTTITAASLTVNSSKPYGVVTP